jgi:hypothetical protein
MVGSFDANSRSKQFKRNVRYLVISGNYLSPKFFRVFTGASFENSRIPGIENLDFNATSFN